MGAKTMVREPRQDTRKIDFASDATFHSSALVVKEEFTPLPFCYKIVLIQSLIAQRAWLW